MSKRGKKWAVVNTKTGKVKGGHDTKKKADAQRRALYANEPRASKPRYRKPKTKRKRKRGR